MRYLVVALLLTLATAAEAITITSGRIQGGQTSGFAPAFNIQGTDGYSLTFFQHGVAEVLPFPMTARFYAFDVTQDFSSTAPVRAQGLSGSLTYHIQPFVVTATDTLAEAPFSMVGTLNGTPVDGRGLFTLEAQGGQGGWEIRNLDFVFSAPSVGGNLAATPEPATLFLVGTGLVAAAVAVRRRRCG